MAICELKIAVDTSEVIRVINQMRRDMVKTFREIPFVEAADGTKWADVSALIDLADKWEVDSAE